MLWDRQLKAPLWHKDDLSSTGLSPCREAGSDLGSSCPLIEATCIGANRLFPGKRCFWVNWECLEICAKWWHPCSPLARSTPGKRLCFNLFWKKHLDFLFQHKINFEICWKVVYTYLSLKGFCLGDGKSLRGEVRHLSLRIQKQKLLLD